jgi:hypothetical protein
MRILKCEQLVNPGRDAGFNGKHREACVIGQMPLSYLLAGRFFCSDRSKIRDSLDKLRS